MNVNKKKIAIVVGASGLVLLGTIIGALLVSGPDEEWFFCEAENAKGQLTLTECRSSKEALTTLTNQKRKTFGGKVALGTARVRRGFEYFALTMALNFLAGSDKEHVVIMNKGDEKNVLIIKSPAVKHAVQAKSD